MLSTMKRMAIEIDEADKQFLRVEAMRSIYRELDRIGAPIGGAEVGLEKRNLFGGLMKGTPYIQYPHHERIHWLDGDVSKWMVGMKQFERDRFASALLYAERWYLRVGRFFSKEGE